MQKDIKHTRFYQHPPEVVWEALTNSELLGEWLMQNNFKPEVGHQFQFATKARSKANFDGNVFCEVLEVQPLKKLSYSWKGGPGKGIITLDSVVTWTLTQKDGGTELTLEHSGFKGLRNYLPYLIMNQGWKLILKRLIPKLDAYAPAHR